MLLRRQQAIIIWRHQLSNDRAVLEVLLHSSITLIDDMIYTDFQKYDATHTGLKFAPNARKPYTYMHVFVPFVLLLVSSVLDHF